MSCVSYPTLYLDIVYTEDRIFYMSIHIYVYIYVSYTLHIYLMYCVISCILPILHCVAYVLCISSRCRRLCKRRHIYYIIQTEDYTVLIISPPYYILYGLYVMTCIILSTLYTAGKIQSDHTCTNINMLCVVYHRLWSDCICV